MQDQRGKIYELNQAYVAGREFFLVVDFLLIRPGHSVLCVDLVSLLTTPHRPHRL